MQENVTVQSTRTGSWKWLYWELRCVHRYNTAHTPCPEQPSQLRHVCIHDVSTTY